MNTTQLLYGTLLGDGYMFVPQYRGRKLKHPKLIIAHSVNQSALVHAKCEVIKEYVGSQPRIQKNGGWGVDRLKFETKTSPDFEPVYKLCYPGGKKVVTYEWLDQLDEVGLAWWIMDDGTRAQSAVGMRISTEGFSYDEHLIIQDWFWSRWALEVGIMHAKRGMYCIKIGKLNAHKLSQMIQPYIIPSMAYKLQIIEPSTCQQCSKRFLAYKEGTRYCGDQCRAMVRKKNATAYYYRHRDRILAGQKSKRSKSSMSQSQSLTFP